MGQSVAARCVVPGQTGCRVSAAGTIATEDDVLTPNCWDACWDEMPLSGIPEPPPNSFVPGDSVEPACRKEHHLGKVFVRVRPTCTFANSRSMIGVFG